MKPGAQSKTCGKGCNGGDEKPRRSRRPAEQTRQDILQTAENLFRDRGYQQVAMADIAAQLGMSPANVFKHFHSKGALVDAIACAQIDDMMGTLDGIETLPNPQQKLHEVAERLLRALLQHVTENPHVFEMIVLCSDPSRMAGAFYRHKLGKALEIIIEEGHRDGIFHVKDAAHTASVVTTALGGVLNPLAVCQEGSDILYSRCRDLVVLVIAALQNPLAK
ncbi:TetR/AcrR family transcriptional regulator [Allorhizobium undicola]|uniref:TetR/AcrR family transcriptional regulator n=1 Tax=Allorhizobium undicola TaxID=78527 RepID=UPI000686513A|nr:TetR/AcrR family transcriptional regulator [Allorhizobium undicola]